MKYIFGSFRRTIASTPFLGRTIVLLTFFFLFVKQAVLVAAYREMFVEATTMATLLHYIGYLVSDGFIYIVLLMYMLINLFIRNKIIRSINILVIWAICFFFALDIFTMGSMQSRVSLIDLNQFVWSSISNFMYMVVGGIAALFVLWGIAFWIAQRKRFLRTQKTFVTCSLIGFAALSLRFGLASPHGFDDLPDNIFSLNILDFQDRLSDRGDGSAQSYSKFFSRVKGSGQRPNIIVVFAESLSPIDSLRVGGVHDNLPYFDLISQQGITFNNFINNGCTSDTAHISLLMGIEPLKLQTQQLSSYTWYTSYTQSLPLFFAQQWYTPIFVSAVDLDFLDQRDFLSGVGFSTVIDEHAFTGMQKYVFDAAPDRELYDKTLSTISTQTSPYFLALQTISFHKPYNTPYGKSQSDALRYADKSLYYFYLQLKKSGFFDNGLLVIVSDHRKMEPLQEGEKEALDEYRYTRWLATIVGTGILPGIVDHRIIQHTDIFYGLKQWISQGTVTIAKLFNDIFSESKHRDRGITYCRYFQNSNKYSLTFENGSGAIFNELSQIAAPFPLIHKYLSSYVAFESGTGALLSWSNPITIIAHQWSPVDVPENSLEGFLLAKSHGADGIEMDISYTKDHHNVVIHGERTWATTCSKNVIVYENTLEYLTSTCPLKNGELIMTLEEILTATKWLFDYYFVDIKVYDTSDAEQQVLDAVATVQKLGMQDKVIFTSYDKTATYILWSSKDIIAWWDTYNLGELDILPNMNHQYYMMPQNLITATTPQEVWDIGKKLVIYTVNTTGDIQKLYDQGVRIIMTDNVPLMKEWSEGLSQ